MPDVSTEISKLKRISPDTLEEIFAMAGIGKGDPARDYPHPMTEAQRRMVASQIASCDIKTGTEALCDIDS